MSYLRRMWCGVRRDVLLAFMVLLAAITPLQRLMPQQASRYALTAALVDWRTVSLSGYEYVLGIDHASRDEVLYSDKAPGQPFFAAPVYAVYRSLGGEPLGRDTDPYGDVGLWLVTMWSASLPAALLSVVMRRFALRAAVSNGTATAAAVALSFSTMLLPFSTQLFAHVLAALLGLSAYMVLTVSDARPHHLFACGMLCGLAVTVEYPMVIVVVALVVLAVVRHRAAAGWMMLGGLPSMLFLAVYHSVAFGSPLTTPYQYGQFGPPSVGLPKIGMTVAVLLGERGLLTLTPVVVVGLAGTALLIRDRDSRVLRSPDARLGAIVAMFVVLAFVALMGGWGNPYGGASPGPRYIVPALAWLAPGVAVVACRHRSLVTCTALIGTVVMALATYTMPLAQPTEPVALRWWLGLAIEGETVDSVFTRAVGTNLALLLPLGLAMAAGARLWWLERRHDRLPAISGADACHEREAADLRRWKWS